MKMHKVLTTGVVLTIMSMGYVHQRVEIVKAEYDLQKNRRSLSSLVERNSKLAYDLSKLESPRYLLASLNSDQIRFAKNRKSYLKRDQLDPAGSDVNGYSDGLLGRLFDLFIPNAEARSRE